MTPPDPDFDNDTTGNRNGPAAVVLIVAGIVFLFGAQFQLTFKPTDLDLHQQAMGGLLMLAAITAGPLLAFAVRIPVARRTGLRKDARIVALTLSALLVVGCGYVMVDKQRDFDDERAKSDERTRLSLTMEPFTVGKVSYAVYDFTDLPASTYMGRYELSALRTETEPVETSLVDARGDQPVARILQRKAAGAYSCRPTPTRGFACELVGGNGQVQVYRFRDARTYHAFVTDSGGQVTDIGVSAIHPEITQAEMVEFLLSAKLYAG